MRIDEILVMAIVVTTTIIVMGIVISYLYAFFSGLNSEGNNNFKKSNNSQTPTFYDFPQGKLNVKLKQEVKAHKKVTEPPKTINSQPELLVSLIGGEFRTFQNYYINGIQYTFGFPNDNCKDKRIWVGIGKEEVERITYEEAMKRIHNKSIDSRMAKQIDNRSNEGNALPF